MAADRIAQIQAQYGTQAAYLAGFALVLLKQQQSQYGNATSQRDLHAFTYSEEMRDTPAALQLYEEAAAHLLSGTDKSNSHVAQ